MTYTHAIKTFILSFFHLFFINLCYSQSISPGDTSMCEGQRVILTANPAGNSYQWRRNGSPISNAISRTYSASVSGNYDVIVTTAGVPVTYPSVTITINPKPVALFSFIQTDSCFSNPIQFNNQSSPLTALNYSWDFGDINSGSNNFSTAQNPLHRFVGANQGGSQTFTVKLKVTNSFGCDSTYFTNIRFNQPSSKLGGTGFESPNIFKSCNNTTTTFTFINQSTTTNIFYEILFGDNTSYSNSTLTTINHNYSVGEYTLKFIVTGANGCKDTGLYRVFVSSSPAGGPIPPGNTIGGCVGTTISFPLSATLNTNLPSTTLHITINDGTDTVLHFPFPPFFVHTFNQTSCGISPSNSFTLIYEVINLCATIPGTIGGIKISDKPIASFTISPKDTICTGTIVTFASPLQQTIVGNACVPSKVIWKISPGVQGIDWIVTSGTIGNDYGLNDPSAWDSGTHTLRVRFLIPRNYQIRLKTGGACGSDMVDDSLSKNICVNPVPSATYTGDTTTIGCAPLTIHSAIIVNTINTCGTNKFEWTVTYIATGCVPVGSSYTYILGDSTSKDPVIRFNNPGKYTLSLMVFSPAMSCSTLVFSKQITVKGKPNISLTLSATSICQNQCITITKTVTCDTANSTYTWSFPGGNPSASSLANPGIICYPTPGNYIVTLIVTNECGSDTVLKPIVVKGLPPTPHVTSNSPACSGGILNLYADTIPGATYNWTGPSRPPYIPSSSQNPVITIPNITIASSGIYYVTATINGCTSLKDSTVVKINPKPAKPVPCVRIINYCLNSIAVPLCDTALLGNTLYWCMNYPLSGCSSNAPTPSTSVARTIRYYLFQKTDSSGCESDTTIVTVIVSPAIGNDSIKSDQVLCAAGITPTPLMPVLANPTGGNGSFTYQWQDSSANNFWFNVLNATGPTYTPGIMTVTTKYRRIARSGGCADTSNVITITVGSSFGNINIDSAQTICAGNIPTLLTGPSGLFTYQWYDSVSNRPWRLIDTTQNYQPPALDSSTYYRRKVTNGNCSAYSLPALITVYKKPIAGTLTPPVVNICRNSSITLTISSSNTILKWQIGSVPANGLWQDYNILTNTNTFSNVQNSFSVRVIVVTNGYGQGCNLSDTSNIAIINVFSKPVGGHTNPNDTVCIGTNAGTITISGYSGQIAGWQYSSNNGLQWNTIISTASSISYNNLNTTTWYRAIIKNGPCDSAFSDTTIISVVTNGDIAVAMADTSLCADSSTLLHANTPINGYGTWSKISGPANNTVSFSNQFSPITTVYGLIKGSYNFRWQIRFSSCTPTYDDVRIDVYPTPDTANAGNNEAICGNSITLHGNTPINGTGSWSKVSGGNAVFINNSSSNATVINLQPGTYIFKWSIKSGSCQASEDLVQITVYDSLPQAFAGGDTSICNQPFFNLSGSNPLFGSGKWMQSAGPPAHIVDSSSPHTLVTSLLTNNVYKFLWIVSGPVGCGVSADDVTITVRPAITVANVGNDTFICNFPFISSVALHANIDPARVFEKGQWSIAIQPASGNGSFSNIYSPNAVFSFSDVGQYKLVWTISSTETPASCPPSSDTITIHISSKPSSEFKILPSNFCLGETITVQNLSMNANRFVWDWGDSTYSFFNEGHHTYRREGTYLIKLIAKNALAGETCNFADTFQISILINPLPKISISKSNNITCILGSAKLLVNGDSINSYKWSPSTGLSNDTISNPIAAPDVTTTYSVLVVSDKNCSATSSVEVKVIKGDPNKGYFVPSAFTPDGDGKNDCFGIQSWGFVTNLHFDVYTRAGFKVFTTTDPANCWDGTHEGHKLPSDAYVYNIIADTNCGKKVERSGTVVLIR